MKKIICEVCGAAYADSLNRCPICGSVQNVIPPTPVSHKQVEVDDVPERRYPNGGKYSKSNSRKRKKLKVVIAFQRDYVKYIATGLALIMLLVLLLSLFIRSCNNDSGRPPVEIGGTTAPTTNPTTNTDPTQIACTGIELSDTEITFSEAGATHKLTAIPAPEDTTDILSFTTGNANVATVGDDGTITAVGNGYALITVQCGSKKAYCNVTVEIPEPTEPPLVYKLNYEDVTLRIGVAGAGSFRLYLRDQYGERVDVDWVASKDGIVSIVGNTIKGIAKGTVKVSATHEGKTYTCIVRVVKG